MNYGGKKAKNDSNKIEKKKSQNDMNGLIGGLVFGSLFTFVAYQIYNKLIEFWADLIRNIMR